MGTEINAVQPVIVLFSMCEMKSARFIPLMPFRINLKAWDRATKQRHAISALIIITASGSMLYYRCVIRLPLKVVKSGESE